MPLALGVKDIEACVGEELGSSEWHLVTQEGVDGFARATGDHQWIHVDPERAAQGEFGGTIAHGFYTLSLAPKLFEEIFTPEGVSHGVNYGLDRVRFTSPLPVGERVRMEAKLLRAEPVSGGVQAKVGLTFLREGARKPVCIAEWLVNYYED